MAKTAIALLTFACVNVAHAEYFSTNIAGTTYHGFCCRADQVVITWADTKGIPMRTFQATEKYLRAKHLQPEFMMNGGIFNEGGVPTGLLVENGRVIRPLNLSAGTGNFYLKPNGVFYVDRNGAAIVESRRYSELIVSPDFAIQSGPILLLDGRLHPDFHPTSTNRLHRNGVGIMPNGAVLFAITEPAQDRLPNLYEFAKFFAIQGCKNALFLDGVLSQWMTFPTTIALPGNHFGAIISVIQSAIQPGDSTHPPPASPLLQDKNRATDSESAPL